MSATESEGRVHPTARIHPDARIDPSAVIGADVVVEAGAVVGPECVLGDRTRLRTAAIVVRRTTIGTGNDVHPYAVLGGDPQDRSFDADKPGRVEIGDENVFREGVTVHLSVEGGPPTRIGDRNYFMVQAHAAHNVQVGNDNNFANGVAMGGHARVGDRVFLSAFTTVHQYVMIGDLVMCQAHSGASMHLPPYALHCSINSIAGLNAVGMRRAPHLDDDDRREIRRVFGALFRRRGSEPMLAAAQRLVEEAARPAARAIPRFILDAAADPDPRRARRGVSGYRRGSRTDRMG